MSGAGTGEGDGEGLGEGVGVREGEGDGEGDGEKLGEGVGVGAWLGGDAVGDPLCATDALGPGVAIGRAPQASVATAVTRMIDASADRRPRAGASDRRNRCRCVTGLPQKPVANPSTRRAPRDHGQDSRAAGTLCLVTDDPTPLHVVPLPDADLAFTAICRLDAGEVAASRSAVGVALADRISVELGALGGAAADEAHVSQAVVGRLLGGSVETEQTLIGTLVARSVTFRRASGSLVLIAGRVEGEVRTVLDWRGALAAGAAMGLVLGLLRRRR